MGANSSDALATFLAEYLSKCKVVGGRIFPPDTAVASYDPTAGGQRLPTAPPVGEVVDPLKTGLDWKRGQ